MTHVNPENQSESTTSSGLPLRGLAMVLIAVAVLLVMWGLYAATQNQDSGGEQAAPTTPAVTTAAPQSTPTQTETEPETVTETETSAPPETPAPAPAPQETPRLNVINNSTVPNLAADVADRLRGDGFEVGEVGNMADHILPENTVFFQPGNADAEQRARELAERVGGVAREYEGFLPERTDGRNDLTLVLVNQVAL
ncbi:LytR C-terminal domain-containing protein [Corynebacterium nasicanis]|uniref:LytR C-terminal domain-containing protein n=1 Tax=Corynebacterium nasicanis TaxID=1448267 RepID=A0ABW1QDH4_9CORY